MDVTVVFHPLTASSFRRHLLAAAACAASAGVAGADTIAVTKAADTTIDARGLVLDPDGAPYGAGINGNSFTNSAITTFNGYQYTAYWVRTGTAASANYVAVARRPVGSSFWQVANLTQSTFSNGIGSQDAHNVVSLGIDETDGTIHLAYDLHGHTLKYRVSNTGVATNPASVTWSQGLFQTQRNWLVNSSTPVNTVTYPHFIRKNNGGLQLTYRTGSSGAGSNWIADYNSGTYAWGNVHQYDDGFVGTYYGTVTSGDTNRNSYINGATYGPSGRLYQSFTWREGATGAANHDLAFVYSDDNGNTWKNNAGTVVGNNATGQKFNLTSPGLTVVPIDESQTLMNQQTQAVSGNSAATERFHTLMWHRDTAKTTATGDVWDPDESTYFHYWRDGDGNFHRSKLPGQVGSRPKLFFDANDNAFAVYQLGAISSGGIYINSGDLVIAAATKASNWNDWKVIKTETGGFVSEAQADARLFALTGTLSVLMQNAPASNTTTATATAMRAMDYTFNITPARNVTAVTSGAWLTSGTWDGSTPVYNAHAIVNGNRTVTFTGTFGDLNRGALILGTNGTGGDFIVGDNSTLSALNIVVGRDGPGNYIQNAGTVTAWRMAVGDFYTETSTSGISIASIGGGSLTVGELQIAMGHDTSTSRFITAGTANVTVNGEVLLGDLGNYATLHVGGGTMTVAGDIREGLSGSDQSTVILNGGTLDLTGNSIFADNVQLYNGRIQNLKAINNAPINKGTAGTVAFAGNNTFTQPLTITAGAIRAESNSALGTTAGNTVITGGTNTGQLQLAGNITTAEPIVLGGRQPTGTAADAPHLNNVAGTNTLTGTITTASGGNQYNVNSDAGKLIVAGNFVNTGTGGATDVRTLKLTGDGDGEWQSNIANAANNTAVTAVTKNGAGTWTLTGANTYTGPTTINGGTLRLGQAATPNAVAAYGFDSVAGSIVNNTGTGGTAMNGTLTGNATIVAGGQSGNAVSVSNGASVDISNPITDLGPTAAWTVSAWVKTAAAGSTILTKGNGGWASGNTVFYLGDGSAGGSGGLPSGVRYAGGFFQAAPGTASVIDNAWHLVTYVNNSGAYAIYVDGVAQALAAGNSSFGNADVGSLVRLGASTNPTAGDGTLNFNGLLDDVRFFNTALSGAQVAGLYGSGGYGTLPSTTKLMIAAAAPLMSTARSSRSPR